MGWCASSVLPAITVDEWLEYNNLIFGRIFCC